ncbi:MAG: fimbria/pilus periplasmic chaperone [Moraxellaceae bacterium]|nr:fimbria/pilus periplasmic chaperone [Moraxellaceae bacterium]MDP1776817.1 fimbria/pilus periplasmic chaperone [Moraxellaceae bacterium]
MMCRLPQRLAALLLAVGLFGLPLATWASQIRISPLFVSLSAEQRSAAINLRNEGRTAVSVQIRVFAWQQDADAGMLLDTTQDLALSPAMVTLAPGATQLVRVQTRMPAVQKERHYRILIDQLPDAASASRDRVRVLTRYSLPVFVEPRVVGLPNLSAKLVACQADGSLHLRVANAGSRRARLADWQLLQQDKALSSHNGLTGYALPGQVLSVPLVDVAANRVSAASTLHWQVNTDMGPWQTTIASLAETVPCATVDALE